MFKTSDDLKPRQPHFLHLNNSYQDSAFTIFSIEFLAREILSVSLDEQEGHFANKGLLKVIN
jgi:hypothetical protein